MSAWQTFKNGTRQFLKTSCSIYGYFYFKCLIIIGGWGFWLGYFNALKLKVFLIFRLIT